VLRDSRSGVEVYLEKQPKIIMTAVTVSNISPTPMKIYATP
jgi:hypothetical protein